MYANWRGLDRFSQTSNVDSGSRHSFAFPAHHPDRLRSFVHAEIPSLTVFFHPDQRTSLRTAANGYAASVPAVKKSWGSQKIAHVSYGDDAGLRAMCDVE